MNIIFFLKKNGKRYHKSQGKYIAYIMLLIDPRRQGKEGNENISDNSL